MVMDALERSPATQVFHERDPRAFYHYQLRGIETLHKLRDRSKARVMVVKALCELDLLPTLLREFSPSRAVWVVRHWRDSVHSQLRSFPRHPGWIRRTLADPSEGGWIGRGLNRQLLMEARSLASGDALDDVEAAALFWWFRNRLLVDTGLDADERVLVVSYERLVGQPQVAFSGVFAHLGLALRPRWVDNIHARSVNAGGHLAVRPAIARACDALHERLLASAV